MLKKIVKGGLIGAAAFMIAAPAQATLEIHLFGASAQYKFWTAAAPEFLDSVCTGAVQHAKQKDVTDNEVSMSTRDSGIVQGFDCQGTGEHVVISYTTFASIKGIQAVKGSAADDGCINASDRGVPDWNDMDGDGKAVTWGAFPGPAGTIEDLACQDIHIGASDVAGETFGQESHGQLKGPNGGGWYDAYANSEDTTGLLNCRPIVVPFSFFAHQDSRIIPGSGQGNMTRLMATLIFSGQVNDWSDFGYAAQPITACMRHAGSGTHATLDADVFRGEAELMKLEALPGSFPVNQGFAPVTYFNKGSSDMMKCIRDAGAGAVGYADSDKNGSNWNGSDGSYPTVTRLEYMGEDGVASNVKNGIYDFWSAQWLYYRSNEDQAVKETISDLCGYAGQGINIPDSRVEFWVAADDMRVEKITDFKWPSWVGDP